MKVASPLQNIPLMTEADRSWAWVVAASGKVERVHVRGERAELTLAAQEQCETYTLEGESASCCTVNEE